MSMDDNNDTPIAIITGGSGYVGQAIVKTFIEDGWLPIIASRIPYTVKGAEVIVCDITNGKSVSQLVKKVVEKHDSISACIHAAAPETTRKPLIEISSKIFDNEFDVSVRGAYLLARETTPYMKENSAFIGITTHSLETPNSIERNIGAYLPAKQALRALLRTLSYELEEKKIRVYAVAPKFMPGGLNSSLPERVRTLLSRQDDGSTTSADDVASVVSKICKGTSAFPPGTSVAIPSKVVTSL